MVVIFMRLGGAKSLGWTKVIIWRTEATKRWQCLWWEKLTPLETIDGNMFLLWGLKFKYFCRALDPWIEKMLLSNAIERQNAVNKENSWKREQHFFSITGVCVVNAFVFVFMVRCLLLKIKVRLLTDLIANVFRLLMSSDVSSVEPRYLHFFQSPLFLFILYSSVFDSFIAMSRFVSNFGVSSLNLCNQ